MVYCSAKEGEAKKICTTYIRNTFLASDNSCGDDYMKKKTVTYYKIVRIYVHKAIQCNRIYISFFIFLNEYKPVMHVHSIWGRVYFQEVNSVAVYPCGENVTYTVPYYLEIQHDNSTDFSTSVRLCILVNQKNGIKKPSVRTVCSTLVQHIRTTPFLNGGETWLLCHCRAIENNCLDVQVAF